MELPIVKLVKFTKDVPTHSAFSGEVMGFDDEMADRLVRAGKALPFAIPPEQVVEIESVAIDPTDVAKLPVVDGEEVDGTAAADAVEDEAADEPADDAEPKKRGRGRPRKAD